jgi:hypothetical protein
MTVVKIKPKPPETSDGWSPAKLYSRGQEGRRILFLELIAWAIVQAEAHETREEWDYFANQLASARREVWGERPWPGAKDNDTFFAQVRGMANVFANSHPTTGVRYERRKTDPLEVEAA